MGGLVGLVVSNPFAEVVGGASNGRKVTYPLPGMRDCLVVEEEGAVVPLVVVVVFPFPSVCANCFGDVGWWGVGRDLT